MQIMAYARGFLYRSIRVLSSLDPEMLPASWGRSSVLTAAAASAGTAVHRVRAMAVAPVAPWLAHGQDGDALKLPEREQMPIARDDEPARAATAAASTASSSGSSLMVGAIVAGRTRLASVA